MKHLHLLWCACCALMLCPRTLSAQEASASREWTLQECIDYALLNNLELKQKQVSLQQSEVDIKARKGMLFPSLSFATNQNGSWRPWSSSYVNITDGTMAETSSTLNYNGSYGLQSQWTIWNGGINRKQVKRSELSRDQALTDEQISRLSIQEQIVQLYVQILYQTEAVEVCKTILESTGTQLRKAEWMYEVGSMSRSDLAQVQAQMSQEEYNVASAVTTLSEMKMQLRQLLELPADADFSIAAPSIDDSAVLKLLPTVAEVYEQAAATRPELRYSRLGIEAAELDIDIARRGRYPTVSMQAAINTSTSSGIGTSWADQIKTNLSNSIGLNLSVPIFDYNQTSTNVAKARLDRESSAIALSQQERELYNDIESLRLNGANAQQQYRYALANVESMDESYQLVSQQFEVGLKDIVDLTTAKNNLVQAQQQLLQSKYTSVLNRALLYFYQGQPLTLN